MLKLQALAGRVDLYASQVGSHNISVVLQPKWLKFGLKAHFSKIFRYAKFQLSISDTFRILYFNKIKNTINGTTQFCCHHQYMSESVRDTKLKLGMCKPIEIIS